MRTKTIEERAELNLMYEKDFCGHSLSDDMVCRAYIRGAEEQKAIDEEVQLKKSDDMTQAEYDREVAFANWYHQNRKGTPTFSDAIEWAREEGIEQACEWLKENIEGGVHPQSAYGFVEKFRKAMKESYDKDKSRM